VLLIGPPGTGKTLLARAERAIALGLTEEVDDLHQLILGLVDAGHVGKADGVLLRSIVEASPALQEPERVAGRPLSHAAKGVEEEDIDEDERHDPEHGLQPERRGRAPGLDAHVAVEQRLDEGLVRDAREARYPHLLGRTASLGLLHEDDLVRGDHSPFDPVRLHQLDAFVVRDPARRRYGEESGEKESDDDDDCKSDPRRRPSRRGRARGGLAARWLRHDTS
jgi:hypothetical protein